MEKVGQQVPCSHVSIPLIMSSCCWLTGNKHDLKGLHKVCTSCAPPGKECERGRRLAKRESGMCGEENQGEWACVHVQVCVTIEDWILWGSVSQWLRMWVPVPGRLGTGVTNLSQLAYGFPSFSTASPVSWGYQHGWSPYLTLSSYYPTSLCLMFLLCKMGIR
jgi:hypothetical protein